MLVLFILVALLFIPAIWFVGSHLIDGYFELKIRCQHSKMLSRLSSKEFIDGNAYVIKTFGESKTNIELMPSEAYDLIKGNFELVVIEPKNKGSPKK